MSNKNHKEIWHEISWKDKPCNLDKRLYDFNCCNNYVPTLDNPITLNEINEAGRKLKNISTADGITPSIVNNVSGILFRILLLLFNVIIQFRFFPTQWRTTIVSAIFKCKACKGSVRSPINYRPISLVEILSKLFDFILLNRFKKWFKPHDSQSAYQSKRSCADLLKALIQHSIITKSRLFIICIDFEGAIDKISRNKLFTKLHMFGAGTTFLFCLMTIYMMTDYVIFGKDSNYSYHLYCGIKQGLPLTPFLFLFYLI